MSSTLEFVYQNAIKTPHLKIFGEEDIYLKAECLQPFGSYKVRGASAFFASREMIDRGVVTVSAGNLAQAVAFLARKNQVKCKVLLPKTAPENKKKKIRDLGATTEELSFSDIWRIVNLQDSPNINEGEFIHPIFCDQLLQGYGSIVDEIASDLSDLQAVIAPYGLGGLITAIVRRVQELSLNIKVYAAEYELTAPFAKSLQAGKPIEVPRRPSVADAIGAPAVLTSVFDFLCSHKVESILVSEEQIRKSMQEVMRNNHLVIEGAAAAAVAAAKVLRKKGVNGKILAIATGGNVDQRVLSELL